MKILHVIPTLSPRFGGPSKACLDTARRLVKAGHHAEIFTTDREYPTGRMNVLLAKRTDVEGVGVTYYPASLSRLLISPTMGRALSREMPKFDVLHIHGLYRYPMSAAAHYARKHGVPYIIKPFGS